MKLSVILCTHNPRLEYLPRTLEALRSQTVPRADWKLVLIDNRSAEPLASRIDLSWDPEGRHFRQEELGLTPARLCGIAEAQGDLLIFVNDDNVLQGDYLETASRISVTRPDLGAFGGSVEAEFEVEPDPRFQAMLPSLAIRSVKDAKWANFGMDSLERLVRTCLGRSWTPAEEAARVAEGRAARDIRLLKIEGQMEPQQR